MYPPHQVAVSHEVSTPEVFAVVVVVMMMMMMICHSLGEPHPFRVLEVGLGCPGGSTWPFGHPETAALDGGPQVDLAPADSSSLTSARTHSPFLCPAALS